MKKLHSVGINSHNCKTDVSLLCQYLHSVTSKYPTDNSYLVLSCTVKCVAKSLCKFYFLKHSHFVLWNYLLILPNHAVCILSVDINILILTKYFGFARGWGGGVGGTYLYKIFRFSVCLIVTTNC